MARRAASMVALLVVSCLTPNALAQSSGPLLTLTPVGYPSNADIVRPIDLDGDGTLDVVDVFDNCPIELSVRENTGGRTLGGALASFESLGCGPHPVTSLEIHDVTGDGRTDILLLNRSQNALAVLAADGVGGLRPPVWTSFGEETTDFAVADFDADGRADIVVIEPEVNAVSIYRGDGAGHFQFLSYTRGSGPDYVSVGDLNADGNVDVATVNQELQTMTAFLGDGTGRIAGIGDTALPGTPVSLAVGDLNGDGRADVVVPAGNSTVSVFLSAGDGHFAARRDFASTVLADARADAHAPLIADLQGDGLPDVVVNHWRPSLAPPSFSVLYGDGAGSLSDPESFAGRADDAADFDGDGRLDVLSGRGFISIHWSGEAAANRTPVADAGPDIIVPESKQSDVTLVSRSADPDGHAITHRWSDGNGAMIGTGPLVKPFTGAQPPGRYVFTLTVDDLLGGRATDTVSVTVQSESTGGSNPAGPVVWTATVNTTPSGASVKKTAGCSGCADAGAVSEQDLGDGGWVEFVPTLGGRMYVGLGADGWTSTSYTNLRHAFSFWPDGGWDIREFGQYRTDGRFSQGDVFRIAIENRQVVYSVNGRVVYRSGLGPSIPSQLDTSFLTIGAEIRNAMIEPGAAGGS